MSPLDTEKKIKVYTFLKDPILKNRMDILDTKSFDIIELTSHDDIEHYKYSNSVLIVEKTLYLNNKSRLPVIDGSVILITNEEINLKDSVVNRVPRELFLTKYLEEFIYWTLEKSNLLFEKRKRQLRRPEVEKLITELKVVSRCSILT